MLKTPLLLFVALTCLGNSFLDRFPLETDQKTTKTKDEPTPKVDTPTPDISNINNTAGFAQPEYVTDHSDPATEIETTDEPDIDPDIEALGQRVRQHTGSSQQAKFTLASAFDAALHDTRMVPILAEVQIAHAEARNTRTRFIPDLSARASLNRNATTPKDSPNDRAPMTINEQRNRYGIQASMTLFNGFADSNARRSAFVEAQTTQYAAIEKISGLLFEVVQVYAQAIASQNVLLAHERKLLLANEALKVADARFRLGDITEADYKSAKSAIAQARAEKEKAQSDLFKSRHTLSNLIGVNVDELSFEDMVVPAILPETVEACIEFALKHSPSIKKVDLMTQSLSIKARAARGGFLPRVNAVTNIDHQDINRWNEYSNPGRPTQSTEVSAGLDIVLPIDYKGAIAHEVQKIQYNIEKERANLRYARRNIINQLSILWNVFQSKQKSIDHLEASVKAAASAWQSYREGYAQGTKIAVELLQSERDYISAEIELIKAKQERIVSAYELLHHTGLLTSPTFGLNIPVHTQKELQSKKKMVKFSNKRSKR